MATFADVFRIYYGRFYKEFVEEYRPECQDWEFIELVPEPQNYMSAIPITKALLKRFEHVTTQEQMENNLIKEMNVIGVPNEIPEYQNMCRDLLKWKKAFEVLFHKTTFSSS